MQETQQRNSATDTAEQEERTQQIASVIEKLTRESEAAMKTHMRVDTAREQRDRHFSRAREGEVASETETSPHRQQNALLSTTYPWSECIYLPRNNNHEVA